MADVIDKIKSFRAAFLLVVIPSASRRLERTNFPLVSYDPARHLFQFEKVLCAVNDASLYKSTAVQI